MFTLSINVFKVMYCEGLKRIEVHNFFSLSDNSRQPGSEEISKSFLILASFLL